MVIISAISFIFGFSANIQNKMLFDYFIFALSIPNAIEILVATSFTEFGYNPNCVIGFLSGI